MERSAPVAGAMMLMAFWTTTVAAQTTADSLMAITAERMVDVVDGRVIRPAVVIVRHGRIAAAGARGSVAIPAAARLLDLGDATLLPGFIDTHVHLTLSGAPRANAVATLRAGFTTVQDLGSLGYDALRLRDSISTGAAVGPRILASGPWLGVSGGICDFNGIGVRGSEEMTARIRADVERRSDLIKLCVTGWPALGFTHPDSVELDPATLQQLMDQSRRAGRPAVAHAIARTGAASAVRAGVAGLAHSAFLDDATIQLMRERGTWIASTLVSFGRTDSTVLGALKSRMQAARAAGVAIVLGTDAGVIPHGSNAREFSALVLLGMSPLDALRAGTIRAARALGIADSLGSLSDGKLADIIAVAGDPTTVIGATQRVVFVMKEGRIVSLREE